MLSYLKKAPLLLNERTVRVLLFTLSIPIASLFFGRAIVGLNMRLAIITFLLLVLGVCSLRIWSGMVALMIFIPFMAFLRRYIYVFDSYVGFDPILLVFPVLTVFIFFDLIMFHQRTIFGSYRKNPLVKYTTLLLLTFIISTANPLQGGPVVGISGALFFLIPVFWFYFGRFVDEKRINYILTITVVIGFVTALYGLRQVFFGYLPFELY